MSELKTIDTVYSTTNTSDDLPNPTWTAVYNSGLLRILRRDRGESASQVLRGSGIPKTARWLYRKEAGFGKIRLEDLRSLATYYDICVSELLSDSSARLIADLRAMLFSWAERKLESGEELDDRASMFLAERLIPIETHEMQEQIDEISAETEYAKRLLYLLLSVIRDLRDLDIEATELRTLERIQKMTEFEFLATTMTAPGVENLRLAEYAVIDNS